MKVQRLYLNSTHDGGPQGFCGSRENVYLFSGSWGALITSLGELGSIKFWGSRSADKMQNNNGKASIFLKLSSASGGIATETPL